MVCTCPKATILLNHDRLAEGMEARGLLMEKVIDHFWSWVGVGSGPGQLGTLRP